MPVLVPSAIALRAHDIHQGLHEVDRNSPLIATELEATQLVGMAGAVAAWIKGHDVIHDAQALKVVAAAQLDVDAFAFERVIGLLEERDFVGNVRRTGHRIDSFYETVPEDFESMYGQLGAAWHDQGPTEIEGALLGVVDRLSHGPQRLEDLDIAPAARQDVVAIGTESQAIQLLTIRNSQIAYSPFFSYENPKSIETALAQIDVDRLAKAFSGVRQFQGTPLSVSPDGQLLNDLVAAGVMAGPSLQRPDQSRELFAVAPYGFGPDVLTIKRPLLEKALAVLAAVRMGQHFGGITSLNSPVALLNALLQPGRTVAWHSSTKRQYGVLQQLGIVRFVSAGSRSGIQLVDFDDNKLAVGMAIDLLNEGEVTSTKGNSTGVERALLAPGHYRTQIQGIRPAKQRTLIPVDELSSLVEAVMGWGTA